MCLDAGEMEDIYTRNTVQYFHAISIFILIAFSRRVWPSRAAPNLCSPAPTFIPFRRVLWFISQ
jgi:hypothetical protein